MAFLQPRELTDRARRLAGNKQILLSMLAVAAGLLGGGGAIAFREAIQAVQFGFFGFRGELFHSQVADHPWWWILLAPAGGGLIVGLFLRFFSPERRALGVADVIEASALRGGRMSLNSGLRGFFISVITIGSGGSAGREGPVVHFAAALSAKTARLLHLDRSLGQTLLGCGVAAGVAASFNAPIAGVFFALEVVTGNYALGAFAPVVIASVTGTIVSRAYFGDFPAFVLPPHEISSVLEFPAFALLGAMSAVIAMSFVWATDVVRRTQTRLDLPVWLRPCVAGLCVGAIGLMFPQVMGVGYEATDQALKEELALNLLIVLIVLKTAATAITLGSGFGGGVFSPSLFLGAMLGGAFGVVATEIFPHLSSGHGAYTLVGMGAVAGAVLGAPISTILIVFEMTGDYELTIAVMIATVIASQIMATVFRSGFFGWQLAERGVNLAGGREGRVLRETKVRGVMKQDYVTVQPAATLQDVRVKLQQTTYAEVFVVDEEGILVGTVTLIDLAGDAFDRSHDAEVRVIDVCRRDPPTALQDDDLEEAMWFLEGCGEEHVAVIDSPDGEKLVGVLHERDVLALYHHTVLETRNQERI
ncbi:chloride channel protein [Marivibrio halodurans]